MILQVRDREILSCIYEQRFLLMHHVENYFFKNKSPAKARERILELGKSGFICKETNPILGNRKCIRLTQLGIQVVEEFHALILKQKRNLDFRTLNHDAIVSSVRLRIKQLWDGVWIPESALKIQEYPQIPDGVIVFPSRRKIAIEVENSAKGKERFLSLLNRWKSVDIFLVLFVVTQPVLFQVIRKNLSVDSSGLPFGVVQWPHLENGLPKVWTQRGELEIFTRREF